MSVRPPVAPNAADLVRKIGEGRSYRFPQARIAEVLGHDDQSLVGKWWRGEQRIGDESRDNLVEKFPEFAAAIDEAIRLDRQLAKERKRAKRGRVIRLPGVAATAAGLHPRIAELDPIARELDVIGWERGLDAIRVAFATLGGVHEKKMPRAVAVASAQLAADLVEGQADYEVEQVKRLKSEILGALPSFTAPEKLWAMLAKLDAENRGGTEMPKLERVRDAAYDVLMRKVPEGEPAPRRLRDFATVIREVIRADKADRFGTLVNEIMTKRALRTAQRRTKKAEEKKRRPTGEGGSGEEVA